MARCGRPIEIVAISARSRAKKRAIDLKKFRWVADPVALARDPGWVVSRALPFELEQAAALGWLPAHRRVALALLGIEDAELARKAQALAAASYEPTGMRALATHLHPGGVFALWSDDPPDEAFLETLTSVFATAKAHVVKFFNPLLERDSASTVYVATKSAAGMSKETRSS